MDESAVRPGAERVAVRHGSANWIQKPGAIIGRERKEKKTVMKAAQKTLFFTYLTAILVLITACSGVPGGSGTKTGTGGPFTISGTVSGLASGEAVVLQNNGKDNLTVSASGPFTFATTIASGGTYAVTVFTQPTNPAQTCSLSGTTGTGTVTANVTGVTVNCTTNPVSATIGGTVTGLVANTSVILQNNGGDSLTITGST